MPREPSSILHSEAPKSYIAPNQTPQPHRFLSFLSSSSAFLSPLAQTHAPLTKFASPSPTAAPLTAPLIENLPFQLCFRRIASSAYMPLQAADMAAASVVKPERLTYEENRRGATKRMGPRRGRVCSGTMREQRMVAGSGFALRC